MKFFVNDQRRPPIRLDNAMFPRRLCSNLQLLRITNSLGTLLKGTVSVILS